MTINEITIFPAVAKANVGSTINFTYQISPAEYDKGITFASSNNEIMTVRNLCMRFLSEGNVSLIVSNNDGFEKRYNITVGKALSGLDKTQAEIEESLLKLEEQIIKNVKTQSQIITESIKEQQTELFAKTSEFKRLLLADYDKLRTEYEASILKEMNENVNGFETRMIALINEYNNTITTDSEAAYELLSKIRKTSTTLVNELEDDLKIKYNSFKTELTELISERKNALINEINLISTDLKSNVNISLKQVDNTLNYSLDKIEAGMHVAIDNIESSEATALANITVLQEEILKNIQSSLDNIDEIITEHVNEAEKRIDKITDSAISNLRKTEIELKNNLEKATEASLEQLSDKLKELSEKLENKEQLLEAELEKKKTELMDEIQINKDEFILEMSKVKSQLLAQFTDEVAIFFNALSKREQEIIANIVATIGSYDLDIEIIIDAKVEMFRTSIEVIYASFLNNFKLMLDETLINFGDLKEEYLQILLNALNLHLGDLQTAYNKHETDLNNLLGAHIDTLNQLQKDILDFIGRTAEDGLWSDIRANLLEYTENQINRINQVKDSAIARIGTTDDAMYDEDTPSVRKDAIDAIIKKKEENVDSIVGEASDLIKEFISTLMEQRYTCILPAHTSLIQLPDDFSLGDRVRLYVNGILLILDKHYTIDKLNRTITLSEVYSTSVDIHVTEDLPDVNIQAIKDQLYVDGEEYKKNALQLFEDETTRHTTNINNHVENKKTEIAEYTELTAKADADKYINETGKSMIDNYIETDSYVKINSHTDIKISQLNEHTLVKESQLSEHTLKKEEEITAHTELKKVELNEHTLAKEEQLNTHTTKKEESVTQHTNTKIAEISDHVLNKKSEISEYTENQKPLLNDYTSDKKAELDAYNTIKQNDQDAHNVAKKAELDVYVDTVSKVSINAYVQETSKIDINTHVISKKEEISRHANNVTQTSIESIENKKVSSTEEMINTSKDYINQYVASLVEQQFYCEQPSGNSVINLPSDFVTTQRTRVFINGQLLTLGKHYNIDSALKTINLILPYASKTEVFVMTDYATNDYAELKTKVSNLEAMVETLHNEIDNLKNGGTIN